MALTGLIAANDAGAADFTAKTVMEKMDNTERYAFVAGVVEGLAYRSNFLPVGAVAHHGGAVAFVTEWLDYEAERTGWNGAQLTLF